MPLQDSPRHDPANGSGMNRVLTRNIEVLRDKRREMVVMAPLSDRIADRITAFTGSMSFVVLHLIGVAAWVGINSGLIASIAVFDPTFVILATAASVEAIFLSTFVLISQNRAAALADRRADLDLQINLLTEHEVTTLVTLVKRIAQRLEIPVDHQEVAELEKDVAPEAVLDRIRETEQRTAEGDH